MLTAPAIKNIAREAGIPVLQPHSLRSPDALSNLRRLNPDLIVVMAYGQILSQEVIDMAPMGCINAHASLLPRHRGAARIQSAIKSGDAETGITIMHIVRKLDAGDIIAQISTPWKARKPEVPCMTSWYQDDAGCAAARHPFH